MTRDSLKLPSWAVPLLVSAAVASAIAWAQLAGTESASAHASDIAEVRKDHTADVVRLQGQSDSIRFDSRTNAVRDSAWKADAMRILLDLQRRPR